jgi:hypothetical protein
MSQSPLRPADYRAIVIIIGLALSTWCMFELILWLANLTVGQFQ